MIKSERQYHIDLAHGDVGEYVILPGDPGRCESIAKHFNKPKFVTQKREFVTWSGELCGVKVGVTSTGIGGPSAAIAIEELIKCGAHTFIRVGTCGGIDTKVIGGDIIIATAAVRGDGTSDEYLVPDYPAAADFEVTSALKQAAEKNKLRHHIGVVQSKDSFYGEVAPESMPVEARLKARWDCFVRAGCLGSEMEAATLMCVGLTRKVRVGAVLTAIWNVERPKAGLDNPEYHSSDRAIKCAIDALKILIKPPSRRGQC